MKRELTEKQISYLCKTLFASSNDTLLGAARMLLCKGTCIMAGQPQFWCAAVGDYMTITEVEDSIGCYRYTLDLEGLLKAVEPKILSHVDTLKSKITVLAEDLAGVSGLLYAPDHEVPTLSVNGLKI